MNYQGIMEDLMRMADRAGYEADRVLHKDPLRSIRLNVFYRECFEFYKDIEEMLNERE